MPVVVATLVKEDYLYVLDETRLSHKPHLAAKSEILEIEGNGFRPKDGFETNLETWFQLFTQDPAMPALTYGRDYTMHLLSNCRAQFKLVRGKQWSSAVGQGVFLTTVYAGPFWEEKEANRTQPINIQTEQGVTYLPGAVAASTVAAIRVATTSINPVVTPATTGLALTAPRLTINGANFGTSAAQVRLRFRWKRW